MLSCFWRCRSLSSVLCCMLWLFAASPSLASPKSSAELLLRQGRFEEALKEANRVAGEQPTNMDAQELVIDILLTMGDHQLAVAQAQQAVSRDPTNPDLHYLLGRATVDQAGSQAAYEAALRMKPDHARAHMGMGAIHEAAAQEVPGRMGDAAAAYGRAARYDPSLGEAWYGNVRALMVLNRPKEAVEVARRGLKAVPDDPGIALLLAQLEPSQARPVLERALNQQGNDPQLKSALAMVLLEEGSVDGAYNRATEALKVVPSLSQARWVRACAAEVRQGRLSKASLASFLEIRKVHARSPQAAVSRYTPLVAANGRSAMVLLGRGAAQWATNQRDAALSDYAAAARLDPQNDEVARALGLGLVQVGRHAEALAPLQTALAARPWDPSVGLALAEALHAEGLTRDARRLLDRVASSNPANVPMQLLYIQVLADDGDYAKAYGVAKVSMQLVPDPRLVAAFVKVAPLAGRAGEAASVLRPMAEQTGSPQLRALVEQLQALQR